MSLYKTRQFNKITVTSINIEHRKIRHNRQITSFAFAFKSPWEYCLLPNGLSCFRKENTIATIECFIVFFLFLTYVTNKTTVSSCLLFRRNVIDVFGETERHNGEIFYFIYFFVSNRICDFAGVPTLNRLISFNIFINALDQFFFY